MSESILPDLKFEVIAPDGTTREVPIQEVPFMIGRGAEAGNHLQLNDQRISRRCAAVVLDSEGALLEDRGQKHGVFVNGERITSRILHEGDVVSFGVNDCYRLVFHQGKESQSLPELLKGFDQAAELEHGARDLRHLSLLLEATALLQSHLPVKDVLASMIDRAIDITKAERGLLLENDAQSNLRPLVARQSGGKSLPVTDVTPSKTAIGRASATGRSYVELDTRMADALREAQSVVAQQLRSVVAVPLLTLAPLVAADATIVATPGQLLGILYLDSRHPTIFSGLERRILDALAHEAASVMEKARLVQREKERQRVEQELSIAREIQQALLPKTFQAGPYCDITGINRSCLEVGGDYFDILQLGSDRTAFVMADVSGKGVAAALVASLLQGTFTALTLGQDLAGVMNHINSFICDHSDIKRYATLFFGIIDKRGNLEYVNAGHIPPLLIHDGKVVESFPAESIPLGLLPSAKFGASFGHLERGDSLLLCTDGITEAMNPERDLYGTERLLDTVQKNCAVGIRELQSCVLKDVEEFSRGAYQADDITLLILRFLGGD